MRHRTLFVIVAATTLASVGAVAWAADDQPPGACGSCPMLGDEVRVEAADVSGGAAMTFTTEGDVEQLRRNVRAMAARHDTAAQRRRGARMGRGPMARMPPATRTVEDLPNGARILVRPDDPAELGALRAAVKEHARQMQTGCPACPGAPASCPRCPPGEPCPACEGD